MKNRKSSFRDYRMYDFVCKWYQPGNRSSIARLTNSYTRFSKEELALFDETRARYSIASLSEKEQNSLGRAKSRNMEGAFIELFKRLREASETDFGKTFNMLIRKEVITLVQNLRCDDLTESLDLIRCLSCSPDEKCLEKVGLVVDTGCYGVCWHSGMRIKSAATAMAMECCDYPVQDRYLGKSFFLIIHSQVLRSVLLNRQSFFLAETRK